MKKLCLLLVFAVVFGRLQADYAKFPLMERFTNAGCYPCAVYNDDGYSDWVAANDSKLAIISYQTNWPSNEDPMYLFNTTLPKDRVNFYKTVDINGMEAVPAVAFNGVSVGYYRNNNFISQPPYEQLDSLLKTESDKRSPMQVTPKLEIVNDTARISIEVTSEEAMNNIRLQVLIVQSMVDYEEAPGTNGERLFPYVARYALPSINGTSFTIEANDTLTFPFEQALSSALTKQQRLYVVAFVEPSNSSTSNTHSIVQAGMSVAAVPMPEVITLDPFADVLFEINRVYAKAAKDSIMAHKLTIGNNIDYDLLIDITESAATEGWELVSSAVPDAKLVLAPGKSITFGSQIKYIGDVPSCLVDTIIVTVNVSEKALNQLTFDAIALPTILQIPFVDVSNNTKYAYISRTENADYYISQAFQNATYFAKEAGNTLVDIPYWDPQLFTMDILDSLEFLGMATYSSFWIEDNAVDVDGVYAIISKKLQSLTKTKLFLGLNAWTFYEQTHPNEYYMEYYPNECAAANSFLKDMFGVASTEWPWMARGNDEYDYILVTMTGVDDTISSKFPNIILNQFDSSIFQESMIGFFDELTATTTTPVYTVMADADEKIAPHPVPVMAKYDDGITKRFITSFNFAIIPYLPSDNSPLFGVANAIIDWMFPSNFIEDGETNLSTKNGILLSTYPNPVTSVSNLIVHNTNDMPVSAKVYLLDVSGKMVMALFDGTLPIGNNNIELSNSNISAGTYFVVTETAAGKTYMSIAMSK